MWFWRPSMTRPFSRMAEGRWAETGRLAAGERSPAGTLTRWSPERTSSTPSSRLPCAATATLALPASRDQEGSAFRDLPPAVKWGTPRPVCPDTEGCLGLRVRGPLDCHPPAPTVVDEGSDKGKSSVRGGQRPGGAVWGQQGPGFVGGLDQLLDLHRCCGISICHQRRSRDSWTLPWHPVCACGLGDSGQGRSHGRERKGPLHAPADRDISRRVGPVGRRAPATLALLPVVQLVVCVSHKSGSAHLPCGLLHQAQVTGGCPQAGSQRRHSQSPQVDWAPQCPPNPQSPWTVLLSDPRWTVMPSTPRPPQTTLPRAPGIR